MIKFRDLKITFALSALMKWLIKIYKQIKINYLDTDVL